MGGDYIRSRRRERIVYLPVEGAGGGGGGSALPIRIASVRFGDTVTVPFSRFTQSTGSHTVSIPSGSSFTQIVSGPERFSVTHLFNDSNSSIDYLANPGIYYITQHATLASGIVTYLLDEQGNPVSSVYDENTDNAYASQATYFKKFFLFVI